MKTDSGTAVKFSDAAAEKNTEKREALIKQLVSRMTLDEKLFQMGGAAKLGELMNYGTAYFRAGVCERLGIPEVRFTDGPRGVVMAGATCFPVTMARGAAWDPDLEERVGAAIGVEARAHGANLAGSVCINLPRHPGWGRAQETYGEDPAHLGELGAALTRGIQRHVMACVKHFAANSIENSRFWVDVRIADRALHEVYLPHFKKCADAGAASFMAAYNRLNGPHCCHSRALLTDILKEQWGFDGYVVSDWTFGLRGSGAAAAGLDVEMPNALFFGRLLKNKVKSGKIPETVIDAAVTRILRQLARFAAVGGPVSDYTKEKLACKEHTDLALEVARKSIVLLKNENSILPLDRAKIKTVAVIGELADHGNIGDVGSSKARPPRVVTPLEGIRTLAGDSVKVIFESGKDFRAAERAAREADAAIVVAGLTCNEEGEFIPFITKGGDRENLSLPEKQQNFIRAAAAGNKNCVVVLEGGSAITMDGWLGDAAAVLMAWYPGMEGGTAIAEILFGDVNPSGKLPITFPRDEKQLPPFRKWVRRIEYGYYHGYRLFDREKLDPRFPFGFGLSYTTFEYSNLKIEPGTAPADGEISVSVDVKNTGARPGDEIVQLYVGYPNSKVDRPVRELKAFRRVSLAPGEKKYLTFTLPARDLAYYDSATKSWITEQTEYTVFVGKSSRAEDLSLSGRFRIT